MSLLAQIGRHARRRPSAAALGDGVRSLDYAALSENVERLARRLRALDVHTLGIDLDNGVAWALIDLAALAAGIALVPLPAFFSPAQLRHTLQSAGVQAILSDTPETLLLRADGLLRGHAEELAVAGANLCLFDTVCVARRLPPGVCKVTYTSGTTGEPKGVMLRWDQIEPVVRSLAAAAAGGPADRHLALMPLAVLLENVAGLYTALWSGAAVVLPPLYETGLLGAAGLDAGRMLDSLVRHRASTALFTPQTLQGLSEAIADGGLRPDLRFAALGGAPSSASLLNNARALGLPVHEGYGLSECASVVTLNPYREVRAGSVGRPLPHVQVRIDADGEVLVPADGVAAYLGAAMRPVTDGWWRTGDCGYLDADGYLYLTGRKRSVFITANGRNVSPEWVEQELVSELEISQAAVFGEARPWNVAVIVAPEQVDTRDIFAAISRCNERLPDYARISAWLRADQPFTPGNGLLSGTGRNRRAPILAKYAGHIESLYRQELIHERFLH